MISLVRIRRLARPDDAYVDGATEMLARDIEKIMSELGSSVVERHDMVISFQAGLLRVGWNPLGCVSSGEISVDTVDGLVQLTFRLHFGFAIAFLSLAGGFGLLLSIMINGIKYIVPTLSALIALAIVATFAVYLSSFTLPSHVCWRLKNKEPSDRRLS